MYLNQSGYAELFDVSADIIKLSLQANQAFKRCEATFCTIAVGGTYAEKFPDISEEEMQDHIKRVRDRRDQLIYQTLEKENARKADVLSFNKG